MYAREYHSLETMFFVADVVHNRAGMERQTMATRTDRENLEPRTKALLPPPQGYIGAKCGPGGGTSCSGKKNKAAGRPQHLSDHGQSGKRV